MRRQGPTSDFQINVNSQALAASARSPMDFEDGVNVNGDFPQGEKVENRMFWGDDEDDNDGN